MSRRRANAITLRALEGEPLAEPAVREMVVATAHAIAERQGMTVLDVVTTDGSITVKLAAARIEAIGFAVELRRLTTAWYTGKYGEPTLWGEPPDAGGGEDWKQP